MKVTDERFSDKQLEDWLALYDRITANPHDRSEDEAWNLVVMVVFKKIVKELQSYRKRDEVISYDDLFKQAESNATAYEELKHGIMVILDAVDYTQGNCKPNDPVGGVLPVCLIENIREQINEE